MKKYCSGWDWIMAGWDDDEGTHDKHLMERLPGGTREVDASLRRR